jgi:hypothetical protein
MSLTFFYSVRYPVAPYSLCRDGAFWAGILEQSLGARNRQATKTGVPVRQVDNSVPTRFLAAKDCYKIPALLILIALCHFVHCHNIVIVNRYLHCKKCRRTFRRIPSWCWKNTISLMKSFCCPPMCFFFYPANEQESSTLAQYKNFVLSIGLRHSLSLSKKFDSDKGCLNPILSLLNKFDSDRGTAPPPPSLTREHRLVFKYKFDQFSWRYESLKISRAISLLRNVSQIHDFMAPFLFVSPINYLRVWESVAQWKSVGK